MNIYTMILSYFTWQLNKIKNNNPKNSRKLPNTPTMLLPPPGQTRYSTHLRGRDKPHVAGSVGGWGSGRPALGCWAAERWSGPHQLVPRLTPRQSPAPARRKLLPGHRDSLGWHTSPRVIIKVQTIQCIKTSYTWQHRKQTSYFVLYMTLWQCLTFIITSLIVPLF